MKLLHVIGSMDLGTGGTCQAVRNLCSRMVELKCTMEVVCLDDPHSDYLSHETIPIHALGRGRGPWAYHPVLRSWLAKNLPAFDAVILHGLWLYPGYALFRETRISNMPPYFVFPHGMLDPWFQRAPERRFKAIRNWLLWKLIEHRVIHNARAMLFTCAEELRLARKTFHPYQPRHEINVGFGIVEPPAYHSGMVDAFVAKCPGLKGRSFFLFLGRIHPKKGVDLLIKAYATTYHSSLIASDLKLSTLNSQPSTIPALVIAGPGLETDYGRQMQALAGRVCPPGSVLWPGMLTGDAKWGALHHAEVFALTSHQENFGIAVTEALACGTSVLISNQINIWREISENKAGLIADDTPAGVELLLQQWAGLSSVDRVKMKSAAKTCYGSHFRIDLAVQKLHATINDLKGNLITPTQPVKHAL